MAQKTFDGVCKTKHEIVVAYLWERTGEWIPAHEIIKLDTPYGFVGSAGDVRARELARNDCPDKLKNKVERAEGRDIGLDPRFTYFRYRQQPSREDHLRIARDAVREFDALPN